MDAVDDTAAQLGRGSGSVEAADADCTSFLAVLIDLHSEGWVSHSAIPLGDVLSSLLVLLNAHIALDSGNEVAIFGYNGLGAKLLYSTVDKRNRAEPVIPLKGTMIRQFKDLDEAVLSQVKSQLDAAARERSTKSTSVAGPLSLALSYLNKKVTAASGMATSSAPAATSTAASAGTQTSGSSSNSKMRGHILILSAEPDHVGSKYIPAMNSIFTAQKLRIPIDVANFGPSNSFFQQAADFTGGSYLAIGSEVRDGLVAVFTSTFLVSPAVRKYVTLATEPDVDFSAVCFLTKRVVEIGYVCSVCLCIMESVPADHRCPVCRTEYETPTLPPAKT